MKSDLPLSGRRVVVTRPATDAAALCEGFRAAGARVVHVPAFRLAAAENSPLESSLRDMVARAGRIEYDTVVFTSRNGVKYFLEIAARAGAGSLNGIEVVAIGPSTREALERRGIRADVTADPHTAEGVVEALRREHAGALSGRRILYPTTADARDVIPRSLAELGAHIDAVVTYGAVPETLHDPGSYAADLEVAPDIVTFASPTAVVHLEATLTSDVFARVETLLKHRAATACIGPVTETAAREHGYRVEIVAPSHTADGLVEAVTRYVTQEG